MNLEIFTIALILTLPLALLVLFVIIRILFSTKGEKQLSWRWLLLDPLIISLIIFMGYLLHSYQLKREEEFKRSLEVNVSNRDEINVSILGLSSIYQK